MVSRGDIWLVLPPSDSASESAEPHPCVILSPPEIHDYLGVMTIAPISHGSSPAAYRRAAHFCEPARGHPLGADQNGGEAHADPAGGRRRSQDAERGARCAPRDVRGLDAI